VYRVEKGEGDKMSVEIVDTPSKMPEILRDMKVMEPYVKVEILTPSDYNGQIIELGQERRGILLDIKYLTPTRSIRTAQG
jgi:GTP-binding protein LepA